MWHSPGRVLHAPVTTGRLKNVKFDIYIFLRNSYVWCKMSPVVILVFFFSFLFTGKNIGSLWLWPFYIEMKARLTKKSMQWNRLLQQYRLTKNIKKRKTLLSGFFNVILTNKAKQFMARHFIPWLKKKRLDSSFVPMFPVQFRFSERSVRGCNWSVPTENIWGRGGV